MMTVEAVIPAAPADPGVVDFGGLRVVVADGVIAPRPWTIRQSEWATELAPTCRPGPFVELFAGCGHIGLEAARRTGRAAVLVDADLTACALARATADQNRLGQQTEVRCAPVHQAFACDDAPALLLADPPYVPRHDVARFPDDPPVAIDGGPDGLALIRTAVVTVHRFLVDGVPLLLQVRGLSQAAAVDDWLARRDDLPVAVAEVRAEAPDRAVALLRAR